MEHFKTYLVLLCLYLFIVSVVSIYKLLKLKYLMHKMQEKLTRESNGIRTYSPKELYHLVISDV